MKKERLLLVLLIVLAASLVYAWLTSPRQQRIAGKGTPVVGRSATATKEKTPLGESLRLDLLVHDEAGYEAVRRDIFRFYVPKPPKRPVEKAKPVQPPPPQAGAAPPPRPVVTAPPPARFRLLGLVDTGERMRVFLTDERKLFIVSEGDTFGDNGEYRVETLTSEAVEIRQRGRSALIRISLNDREESVGTGMKEAEGVGRPKTPLRRSTVPVDQPRFRSFKKYRP
ncbi:hypothetical protein EDC39_105108 [Geothermobacter ehrlichii]|uniref:Uncharacterized protein n=1 Tax=Geothermobacter ehrlichii TaxID=213224 RepID=A0A5D3WIN5_9BACT|nr:hypothetical protein [Geothermobacter ehrlichii]TYO98739.1 hypothetical protein EDC39_105108 [Geothermobacter ehrlichii]